jgi:hypothetical protein
MPVLVRWLVVALTFGALSCAREGNARKEAPPMAKTNPETMTVKSRAFSQDQLIPKTYTCDGPDLSPPLEWSKPPNGTKSLALLCEDPDAPGGMWVHWVVWGLPADSTALPEALTNDRILSSEARQGKNDSGRIGYGGPCPPPGKPHRYFFRIYALNTTIQLEPGATRKDLLAAIEGHIVGQGELMGRYGR